MKDPVNRIKGLARDWKKNICKLHIQQITNIHGKYIKNTLNSTVLKRIQLENGQKSWKET